MALFTWKKEFILHVNDLIELWILGHSGQGLK